MPAHPLNGHLYRALEASGPSTICFCHFDVPLSNGTVCVLLRLILKVYLVVTCVYECVPVLLSAAG